MTNEEAIEVLAQDLPCETDEDLSEAMTMAIKALEQQPCEDCISRQAVLDTLDKMDKALDTDRTVENYKELLTECYKDLPPVTPKEKTGHWIENAPEYQSIDPPYICSECGNMHLRKTNYCDQCGARMVSE